MRRSKRSVPDDPKVRERVCRQPFKAASVPPELDAIVIGSGIGGLSAAALMARAGKCVLVLEQVRAGGWLPPPLSFPPLHIPPFFPRFFLHTSPSLLAPSFTRPFPYPYLFPSLVFLNTTLPPHVLFIHMPASPKPVTCMRFNGRITGISTRPSSSPAHRPLPP